MLTLAGDERWALLILVCLLVIGSLAFSLRGCRQAPEVEFLDPLEEAGSETVPEPEPVTLTVHVAGAVEEPGVYVLPGDSRVLDALEAAGGAAPGGMAHALNLAEPLVDGERIYVPTQEELEEMGSGLYSPEPVRININTADQRTLETLPGIGPALAQRIVDFRRSNGSFQSIEDLVKVSGIGPSTLENLRHMVIVR